MSISLESKLFHLDLAVNADSFLIASFNESWENVYE